VNLNVNENPMRRGLFLAALIVGCAVSGGVPSVEACPLCKAANEADQNGEPNTKPMAYMYSILFMLAMPATLLGSYGLIFWRTVRAAGPQVELPLEADLLPEAPAASPSA